MNLFSQITFSTRLGISTLNEIQIEAVSPINDKISLFTSTGYAFRSYNLRGYGCAPVWSSPLFNNGNEGISLKLGIMKTRTKIKKRRTKIRNHTFSLYYRRLVGTIGTNRIGGGFMLRENEFRLNDFGLSYINDRALSKRVAYYWSFTYARRYQNTIRRTIITSSPVVDKKVGLCYMFDIGVRIKLAQTNSTNALEN